MTQSILNWLITNYVEIIGTITGMIYVVLSVKQNIWNWFFGIINVGFYIFVFMQSKLYAMTLLQVVYLVMSVYGWYNWKFGKKNTDEKQIPVKSATTRERIVLSIIGIVSTLTIYGLLKLTVESTSPWFDASFTAFSIVGTWMLTQKMFENWTLWIVIDLLAAIFFAIQGMYPSALLYFFFTPLAIIGYFEWKKELKTQPIA